MYVDKMKEQIERVQLKNRNTKMIATGMITNSMSIESSDKN